MAVTLLCAGELPEEEGRLLRERLAVLRAEHAADGQVLARSDASQTDVLAQTAAGRDVVDAAQAVASTSGTRPGLVAALDAAILDMALVEFRQQAQPSRLGLAAGAAIAYALAADTRFPPISDVPDGMAFEVLRCLDAPIALKGETGGIAVVTSAGWSTSAEAVGVVARSAALAQLCASAIEAAVVPPVGEPTAEAVWDALAPGARAASALRSAGYLKSAVLTFRGRGRAIGPIEGDRLLRFGMSRWR